MTIPPLHGGGIGIPPFRIPVLTAPVSTGVPPVIGEEPTLLPQGATAPAAGASPRDDAPISLAGRLEQGDVLPDTTRLALALESATRALQGGRAEVVLAELDAVWSQQLDADSPWYLRGGALQLLGRSGDAEQVLRDAIAKLPRSAAILYLLGVHTAHRGFPDAARMANDHGLSLHPTEPLLWLQRAALSQRSSTADATSALMAHVQSLAPAFPADDWLVMLTRVGELHERQPTPAVQRAITRSTPLSLPAITGTPAETTVIGPAPLPPPTTPLEAAVRYGLILLESPTQSARTATGAANAADGLTPLAQVLSGVHTTPTTPTPRLSWEAITLAIGVAVMVVVPALRIPALMLCGAAAMLLASRRIG
ncbi:MAG: hypothetical protein V4813_01315 [Gemmatimonadota bacterium]